MKKSKKVLSIAIVALVCAACTILAACNKTAYYTYEFNTDGGNPIEAVSVKEGTEYTLPVPQKDGYAFEGWFTDESLEGTAVEKVNVDKAQTFYAKWAKLYKLTLDTKGGELAVSEIELKSGANISEAVKDLTPLKNGLTGVWFEGQKEISSLLVMPASDKTIYAKYKVSYTVEQYKQDIELQSYVKEVATLSGYVGDTANADTQAKGFSYVSKEDEVKSAKLTEAAADNILKVYFDRDVYTVTYYPNYPAGAENNNAAPISQQVVYGTEATVPSGGFSAEGYLFSGWSAEVNGKVVYKTDYLQTAVVNGDGQATQPEKFSPEKTTSLYAVWTKGNADMYNGSDYIFHLTDEDEDVYLLRGGKLFKGEYNTETKLFLFRDSDDKILLKGIFNDKGVFVYYNSTRGEGTGLMRFVSGVGLDSSTKVYFDTYNGIKYSVTDSEGIVSTSEGTYEIEDGMYFVATFTSGDLEGQTVTFVTGYVTISSVTYSAFQVRADEDVELGELVRFGILENSLGVYKTYQLALDGLGTATYTLPTTTLTLRYTIQDDIITLRDESTGVVYGRAYIMRQGGQNGYLVYDESLDNTFTAEDGSTLELDGAQIAIYTNGDTVISGNYEVTASAFTNKNIITVYAGSSVYKFMIETSVKTVEIEGETTTETVYSFERKNNNYAEYYYKSDSGLYKIPLLVFNENGVDDNVAQLYGFDSDYKYVLAGCGTVVLDAKTGRYTYTSVETYDVQLSDKFEDLLDIKSFVFAITTYDSTATSAWATLFTEYKAIYWYSFTVNDGTVTDYEVTYSSTDGGQLVLTAGYAKYTAGDVTFEGSYQAADTAIVVVSDSAVMYFSINTEDKSFEKLDYAPFKAYAMLADGSASGNQYLYFDGKGGAVYTVITKNGEETDETIYEGTVKLLNKTTAEGAYIYQFTSDELSFEFIQLSTSTYNYFSAYNKTYNGTYTSNAGTIVLDGFSFYISYTDDDGNVYKGRYIVEDENIIYMFTSDAEYYFDLTANGGFTVRGDEYGTYWMLDNWSFSGVKFDLDGYGKLAVYTEDGDGVKTYIDQQGSYTVSGGSITLKYSQNSESITLVGEISVITFYSTDFNCFVVAYKDKVSTFVVNADWSVLVLDSIGNAVRYGDTGVKEIGTYTLITDSILYYVNEDSTDACLYDYDIQTGKATRIEYEVRGYYTKDLQSLVFTPYGFARFGASDIYYYTVDDAGKVTIYHRGDESETVNDYGFAAESFGSFDETITYNGEKYYYNSGYAIVFARQDNSTDYPIIANDDRLDFTQLSFAPSGEDEFSVSGTISYADGSYSCTVVREKDDNGNASMYVTVGYYRIDIGVEYTGQSFDGTGNSTFNITGLSYKYSVMAYSFLDLYYQIYSFLGSAYANLLTNTFGTISFDITFDADGEITEDVVNSTFGNSSDIFDSTGAVVNFENAEYKYSDNGLYTIQTVGEDGYTYTLYFVLANHANFNLYAYRVYAFTRTQTLTANDGYTVEVERIITSEAGFTQGALYSISLKLNDEEIEGDSAVYLNDNLYFIARETDEDGVITSTVYYKVVLVEETATSPVEGEELVALYESATVTANTMSVYYTEDGASYVDIGADNVVMLFSLDGTLTYATNSSYDETTGVYTITVVSGTTYTIKIVERKAVIEEAVEQEETEN